MSVASCGVCVSGLVLCVLSGCIFRVGAHDTWGVAGPASGAVVGSWPFVSRMLHSRNAETRNMATGVHDGRDTIVRTMLALTGIATAGLLATGLSIATPAYAASIPADCTVQYGGTTPSMTCTARPAKQVWNLQITCRVETAGGLWVPVQGSKVTGDGTSKVAYCFDPGTATFIIDS